MTAQPAFSENELVDRVFKDTKSKKEDGQHMKVKLADYLLCSHLPRLCSLSYNNTRRAHT